MNFTVYIARLDDRILYVGATSDLGQRIAIHADLTPWWHTVTSVESIPARSPEDAAETERRLIAEYRPEHNKDGVTRRYARYAYTPRTPRPAAKPNSLLLGLAEAARMLGVSRSTLYRMFAEGRIERITLTPGGPRVRRADVIALMDGTQAARSA